MSKMSKSYLLFSVLCLSTHIAHTSQQFPFSIDNYEKFLALIEQEKSLITPPPYQEAFNKAFAENDRSTCLQEFAKGAHASRYFTPRGDLFSDYNSTDLAALRLLGHGAYLPNGGRFVKSENAEQNQLQIEHMRLASIKAIREIVTPETLGALCSVDQIPDDVIVLLRGLKPEQQEYLLVATACMGTDAVLKLAPILNKAVNNNTLPLSALECVVNKDNTKAIAPLLVHATAKTKWHAYQLAKSQTAKDLIAPSLLILAAMRVAALAE